LSEDRYQLNGGTLSIKTSASSSPSESRRNNGAQSCLPKIGNISYQNGTDRNREIKGTTPAEAAVIQRSHLIAEIEHLQNQHSDIPFTEQQLIHKERTELEHLPVRTVAAYLYHVKIISKAYRRHN
jgi:hypothetical protein